MMMIRDQYTAEHNLTNNTVRRTTHNAHKQKVVTVKQQT